MENIFPSFRQDRLPDQIDEYDRHANPRPYAPNYGRGGPYEYTGQPAGFEHLGSPPKQRLQEMDPRTIAQLGYEGPEGERRKVEAINDQIYDLERERDQLAHQSMPRRPGMYDERFERRPHGYENDYRRERGSPHGFENDYRRERGSPHGYDNDYRRGGSRRGEYDPRDPYGGRRGGAYGIPSPVTVETSVEEDGTVVEHVYPNNAAAAVLQRPDYNKISYGRQDSFPEAALQDAIASQHGMRVPPNAYYGGPSSSSYGRRGSSHEYGGSSSDYPDDRRRH